MTERHVITAEYPPQGGGVADYTAAVAHGLARAGEDVHVWCGGREGEAREGAVIVHRNLGAFAPADLARLASALDASAGRRRLLVQWVPHAYGRNALNLGFCRWLRTRATSAGDAVDVMVHEPFLPFAGGMRQHGAAAIQRLMTATVIRSARRVWVATPAWADSCRPFARRARFEWMPVPSGVPVTETYPSALARRELGLPPDTPIVGSFGRGGDYQREALLQAARLLATRSADARMLLIGADSDRLRAQLVSRDPALVPHVIATGPLDAAAVSRALHACTIMAQPYADGVCGRHSSVMAALAHGRPVVTTDGRFTEPVWRESGAVLLVPAAASASESIVTLLDDASTRHRLSNAARQLYDERFDVRHTVAALREAA
jgi:glycosyltransferase involved in cell wall biosynthesis